jgi:predicted nucleotidyltransferase
MDSEVFIEDLEESVGKVCGDSDVVAAYLFGSFARGDADRHSDIDIGILFDREYSIQEMMDISRRIQEETDTGREIDVRPLSFDSPEFSFTVIREGVLLYQGSASKRADLEQELERRYHDLKPLIREYREEMMERLTS